MRKVISVVGLVLLLYLACPSLAWSHEANAESASMTTQEKAALISTLGELAGFACVAAACVMYWSHREGDRFDWSSFGLTVAYAAVPSVAVWGVLVYLPITKEWMKDGDFAVAVLVSFLAIGLLLVCHGSLHDKLSPGSLGAQGKILFQRFRGVARAAAGIILGVLVWAILDNQGVETTKGPHHESHWLVHTGTTFLLAFIGVMIYEPMILRAEHFAERWLGRFKDIIGQHVEKVILGFFLVLAIMLEHSLNHALAASVETKFLELTFIVIGHTVPLLVVTYYWLAFLEMEVEEGNEAATVPTLFHMGVCSASMGNLCLFPVSIPLSLVVGWAVTNWQVSIELVRNYHLKYVVWLFGVLVALFWYFLMGALFVGMTAVVGFFALTTARRLRLSAFISVMIAISCLLLCGFGLELAVNWLVAKFSPSQAIDYSARVLSCCVSIGWFLALVIDPAFLTLVGQFPARHEPVVGNDGAGATEQLNVPGLP